MQYKNEYIFCSEKLISQLDEVQEIFRIVSRVPWSPTKLEVPSEKNQNLYYQEAYNRLFNIEFQKEGGWKPQPVLCDKPKLKGDFLKNDVFVEIQFGNSATVFRDYYKFHMGLVKKLLSLAVLIIPTNQYAFFPDRNRDSIGNMATFEYALEHFQSLTILVPILLIGLLPAH
jgi:hypothetical protein